MAESVINDRHGHLVRVLVVRHVRLRIVELGERELVRAGLVERQRREGDLAVGGVLRLQLGAVGRGQHERELPVLKVLAHQRLGGADDHGRRRCLVGVGEGRLARAFQRMGHAERAVAVVLHRGDHGVHRTVIGHAVGDGAAPDLMQRVAVRAGLSVLHRAQRHAAVGGVNAGRHHIFALEQLERELAGVHVAARQCLGHRHLIGHAGVSGLHRVGVGEGERRVRRSALTLDRQLAGAVVGHLEADRLGRRGVVGHAGHGTALRHLIGEHVGTRLAGLGPRVRRLVGRLVAGGNHVSCTAGGVGSRYGARTLLVACRGLVTLVGGGLVALVGRLGGSVARIRGGLVSVSNSLRGIGSLVGFLGRYSLISGLRGIRFSLVGICGGCLAVHAQGAVKVIQRERD